MHCKSAISKMFKSPLLIKEYEEGGLILVFKSHHELIYTYRAREVRTHRNLKLPKPPRPSPEYLSEYLAGRIFASRIFSWNTFTYKAENKA